MSTGEPTPVYDVVVVGAGPTGLAAAEAVVRAGGSVGIVERANEIGGLARASRVTGHVIDLGGHRLLAATESQRQLWQDLADRLGSIPLHHVRRTSGMLRHGHVLAYPFDWAQFRQSASWGMRALTAVSAAKSRIAPIRHESTLKDWVENRYGAYLSNCLMEPHARKVFGVDSRTIPATWAAQRIADPPLRSILSTVLPRRRRSRPADLDATEFFYPEGGFDVLWSRMASAMGSRARFMFGSQVTEILQPTSSEPAKVRITSPTGTTDIGCRRVIWTGRAEDLATVAGAPRLSTALNAKARRRDLVVAVVHIHPMPLEWDRYQSLYTHDGGVEAQRFQNYTRWTGLHIPRGVIGLEYSCPSGSAGDIRSAVANDLSILGARRYEILGFDVLRDAYSSFDTTHGLMDRLTGVLSESAVPIVSTGRQGAGLYINLDQAMKLGRRAASAGEFRGIVGLRKTSGKPCTDVYTAYQERTDQIPIIGPMALR